MNYDLGTLLTETGILARRIREAAEAAGRLGPIPHALNLAASHVQDALGELYVAQAGGSPGIVAPPPRS